MRCEIAASLIHNPKILFLDEPTIGLDAVSKKIVRDFILKINIERKVTIILTTHDMMDIDTLAKRIILIGKGKILYDGLLKNLKTKYQNEKEVEVNTKDVIKNLDLKGIVSKRKIENGYKFIIDTKHLTVSKFINYISKKYDIEDIDVKNSSIDDVIIKLYKDLEIW